MAQTTENNRSAGFNKVAVIGFGLIGASFAAALREARPEAQLLAVDTDVATRSEAVSRGWATATAGLGFLMELAFLNPRETIAKVTDAEVFSLVKVN